MDKKHTAYHYTLRAYIRTEIQIKFKVFGSWRSKPDRMSPTTQKQKY